MRASRGRAKRKQGMCTHVLRLTVFCARTDSFADRRVLAMKKAIRGSNPFFRPQLPSILVENNNDVCPTDKEGRRLLPDGSLWVVSELGCVCLCAGGERQLCVPEGKSSQCCVWPCLRLLLPVAATLMLRQKPFSVAAK